MLWWLWARGNEAAQKEQVSNCCVKMPLRSSDSLCSVSLGTHCCQRSKLLTRTTRRLGFRAAHDSTPSWYVGVGVAVSVYTLYTPPHIHTPKCLLPASQLQVKTWALRTGGDSHIGQALLLQALKTQTANSRWLTWLALLGALFYLYFKTQVGSLFIAWLRKNPELNPSWYWGYMGV